MRSECERSSEPGRSAEPRDGHRDSADEGESAWEKSLRSRRPRSTGTREAFPTRAYQSLANLAPSGTGGGNPADPYGIPEGICVGDPRRIVEAIRRWESIGVDGINFILNGMETVPQAEVLDSLRLFAKEVMPQFRRPDA